MSADFRWVRGLPFLVIGLAWWVGTDVLNLVAPLMLPSPGSVLRFGQRALTDGELAAAVLGSLGRFAVGLIVGVGLGWSLAVWVGMSPRAATFFTPLAKFFQAVAGVAWIPLAVLWFGISSTAAAFIIFNTAFFVVFYTTLTGVQSISQNMFGLVRTLGGGRFRVLKHVVLPGSLPHVMNGLRVGVGYGWRALIAAEIITSGEGLGVMIWEGQRTLDTAAIVLGLLLIGFISYSMDRLVLQRLERRTVVRWGMVEP